MLFHEINHAKLHPRAVQVLIGPIDFEVGVPGQIIREETHADGEGDQSCCEWHQLDLFGR